MRFARITLGLLLASAGLLATVAGAAAAFWLVGPDNTISTPSRKLTSTGLAVVSAPSLLDRHGPTLHVSASGDKPLFVGVAQDLDVRDYLSGVAHTRLVRFDPPATFGTQDMRGGTHKLTPPGELDWWVAQSATGTQSLTWPIQDGRYDVVVMNADGTPAVGAQVTFGIQMHRLFGICLLVLGAGVLVLALGLALMLRRRRVADRSTSTDTTEIPVIDSTRIPVLVSTAPARRDEADLSPAYRVSPFVPERISPFAPDRVSPFAPDREPAQAAAAGSLEAQADPQNHAEAAAQTGAQVAAQPGAAVAAQTGTQVAAQTGAQVAAETGAQVAARVDTPAKVDTKPVRPTPVAVPAAPMFMTPAAVARAKSPVLIGAGASQRYAEPERPTYDPTGPTPVDTQPAGTEPTETETPAANTTATTTPASGTTATGASMTGSAATGSPATGATATATAATRAGAVDTVPLAESPEFVKSDEAVRRTAALLASGALLLTATSCGLMPPKNSLTVPDSRPAVTLADAQAVVQRYNEINNQANRTRDAKLAATIEGAPTLTQTQAGFVIGRKLDAAGKQVSKPFSYTNPEIGAPQFASYPMRFVVSSGVSDDPASRQLGVWQRASAGSPWLLTHSVYPTKSVPVPSVEGLRTPDLADLNKLRAQPAVVAKDLAAYLTGGQQAPQARDFTPSPGLSKLLELRAKSKVADTAEPYIASVTDTFQPSGTPLAFTTASGDALVFLTLTEQYLQRVEPGSNAYWTSGEATAFSSMVKYTQTLHQDYLHQVALVIPTKSSGKAVQVLSIDPQLTGAGGL